MHRAALRNFLGEVLEKNEFFCAGPNRARTKPSAGSSTLRAKASGVTLSRCNMNPDKLFDYLDGKLSETERAALEERLTSDQQLQREIAVARRIHAGMR